jgi:hypothetical protein
MMAFIKIFLKIVIVALTLTITFSQPPSSKDLILYLSHGLALERTCTMFTRSGSDYFPIILRLPTIFELIKLNTSYCNITHSYLWSNLINLQEHIESLISMEVGIR